MLHSTCMIQGNLLSSLVEQVRGTLSNVFYGPRRVATFPRIQVRLPRCVTASVIISISPKYGPLDFGPPLPVTSSKRKEIPIPYYYDYTYRDKYRYENICAS